jgi:general secretion pathway protein C
MLQAVKRQADRMAGGIAPGPLLTLLDFTLLALLGLALARLVWAIITPVGPVGNWQPQHSAAPADISIIGSFDPFFRQAGGAATAEVSGLGLTLLGTRVDTVSGRGSAIIAGSDGVQSSYAVGDEISPGVRLVAVAFDAATLDTGGRRESLFLDQSAGGTPVTPESAGVPNANRATQARLAADILVTPRLQGTAITGYVLTPKGSGTAFLAAGLQPGDVLVSVGDTPVASISDPAALTRRLDAGGLGITVERAGSRVNLQIGTRT